MKKTLYIPIDTTLDNMVECEKLIKRGDTLVLQIKVFTNGVLTELAGQTIDLILEKSDGKLIQKTITSVSNGTITATLDIQATNIPGLVNGEIELTDNDGQTSSNTFTFNIDNSIANDVIIASAMDIQVLNDMKATIADGENKITEYKAHIIAISDSIKSIEALENIKNYIDTNLPDLENNNAEAVVNNNNLETKNSEATVNISTLTSKNAQAETDIKNLIDTINTANTTKKNLDSSVSTGNTTKANLDGSIVEGNTVIETIKDMDIAYTQHITNADIHVTKAKKDSWDLAALNVKEIINILDKTVGTSNLADDNGDSLVDENGEEFLG